MAASTGDKITDVRNAARPNSARVSSGRSAGGTTLACDNLVGWPTASKVHFVTYTIDSNSNPVAGTQLDCTGIVSGNNIGSFTVVDGTDTGNAVNDVVEMLPTAAWGQDLADALTSQHTRTGTHSVVTATSLTTTSSVTAGSGLTVSAGSISVPANSVAAAALVGIDRSLITTDSNPYKFSAYHNTTQSLATATVIGFNTEIFDTNNNYDGTNKYTVPVSGFYQVMANVYYQSLNAAHGSIQLYKNGSSLMKGTGGIASAADAIFSFNELVQLTAADYIQIFTEFTGGGSTTVYGQAGVPRYTRFSAYLVSRT